MNVKYTLAGIAGTAAMAALPLIGAAATVNLPAGTTIDGTIQQELNSKTAQDGQRFTMVTPSGSVVSGHLSEVARSTITGRKAHMKLNFDSITFTDGTKAPLDASLVQVTQHKQTNYAQAAGQVVGGMIVGNIIGKAVGTNLGGIAGVVGGGLLAANSSSNIDVPQGAAARISLNEPLITRTQGRAKKY